MITINGRKVKPTIQENKWSCAPSSVKMLCSYYKVSIKSEARFRKILNTRKDGTSSKNIIKYLSKYFELSEGYSLDDAKDCLKNKHILFVCINDCMKYPHYVVLTKINSRYAYYLDPDNKDVTDVLKRRTTKYFLKMWKEFDYWFLVPEKKVKISKKHKTKSKKIKSKVRKK